MDDSLVVLPDRDLSSMVFDHLCDLAEPLFEQARGQRSHISTVEDVLSRQEYVRSTFVDLIGGLPERTPLNARCMGSLARDGYRVEKVVFESRPQFFVTANLYLPDREDAGPAVVVPCGHAVEGKAAEPYQRLAQGLVRNGFVVLVYDPIGQGERSQYWDEVKRASRVGMSVPEHEYAGTQALLVGRNFAAWRIWDGLRAIDYLCGRDEVDVARIGCTGCSGGGTLTTYLFALDERIAAAMPVCYVTSREAWLATGMIADAEQVQDGIIVKGIGHADLCLAGAPRALRIGAARGDYFPLDGTHRTYDEVKRIYSILGAPDRCDLAEVDGGHGYSQPLREAAYQWLNQWLGNPTADAAEPDTAPEPPEELWCTPGGHVGSLGSRTVFGFTRDEALALPPPAPVLEGRGDAEQWQDDVRTRLRDLLHCPASSGAPITDQYGAFFRGKCGIERLAFQSQGGITIPGLLFVPDTEGQWPGILYVHEGGKEAEAGPLGTAQMLASEGNVVLAIDFRGVGETASHDNISGGHPLMGVDGYHFYQYGMLGHSLVGRRVHDVLRALAVLIERPEVYVDQVSVVGQGMGGLLALFAAALDGRVATAVCTQSLMSYRALATHEYRAVHPSWFVRGILPLCDLPEIAACVAPRRLVLAAPVGHMRRRVPQAEAEQAFAFTRGVYELFDAEGRFTVAAGG